MATRGIEKPYHVQGTRPAPTTLATPSPENPHLHNNQLDFIYHKCCLCRNNKQNSRSVHLCCSANAHRLPLASYPFRQRQQQHVFVEAVRNLMVHLNDTSRRRDALVHTTSSSGFRIHPVTKRDAGAWETFGGGDNLAIYVEAVDDPSVFCGSQATGGTHCRFSPALPHLPLHAIVQLRHCS